MATIFCVNVQQWAQIDSFTLCCSAWAAGLHKIYLLEGMIMCLEYKNYVLSYVQNCCELLKSEAFTHTERQSCSWIVPNTVFNHYNNVHDGGAGE